MMRSPNGRMPHQGLNRFWIATTICAITVLSGSFVRPAFGAPAKLDGIGPPPEAPFPLEAQPTQFSDAIAAALNNGNSARDVKGFSKNQPSAVDSYGNPIEALKPIDTPDGRKVISAQGLQFEIPNYASGITEIKKPADDLLPPFIGELINNTNTKHTNFSAPKQFTKSNTNDQQQSVTKGQISKAKFETMSDEVNSDKMSVFVSNNDSMVTNSNINNEIDAKVKRINKETGSKVFSSPQIAPDLAEKYQLINITDTDIHRTKSSGRNKTPKQSKHWYNAEHTLNGTNAFERTTNAFGTNTTNTANTLTSAPISYTSTSPLSQRSPLFTQLANYIFTKHSLIELTPKHPNNIVFSTPYPLASPSIPPHTPIDRADFKSPHFYPFEKENQIYIANPSNKNFISRGKRSAISTHYKNIPQPLSSGNFNYPNVPTDIATINRIAAKYQTPLPALDPIAVAASTDGETGTSSVPGPLATAIAATTVDVENAQLVELNPKGTNVLTTSQTDKKLPNHSLNSLPSYILELNDPDIGGPVEYMPAEDGSSLKVIAWDLLPPLEQEPTIITSENHLPKFVSLTAGQSFSAQASEIGISNKGSVSVASLPSPQENRIHSTTSTTTTPKSTTAHTTRPTTTTTTTTTRATTTTRRPTTTTTRRTTTTGRNPTTPTTTTSAPLNPNDFFQLENGDSYTLPSWLADIDDPELDAAVSFIPPENIHEYNDTISRDILPPLEPYTDLNDIELPEELRTTSTTTSRPRTTSTTSKPRQAFTTTPKSVTVSTPRPHWVRAYPTTAKTTTTTTTQRPNSFDDRFSSNHIAQTHDSTFASSSTFPNSKVHTSFLSNSVVSTTTSTTTPKPRLTTSAAPSHHINRYQQDNNRFNENSSTIADHAASTEVKTSQEVTTSKFSNSNPFLPAHNSATRPFSSQNANKFTTVTTTTTTTTTPTTPATPIEENPFDSVTLPSWLADFDYPDLAPGVPFIYNAEDSNSDVSNDLLPPSQLSAETTKPNFITSSPTSFNSFQIAPSSTNRHDSTFASASTSTTRTFAFNNSPSKVITTAKPFSIQNPFAKVPNSNNNNQEAITVPPVLFSPPTADAESKVDIVAVNDVSKADPRFDRENAATTADQFHNNKHSSSSFNNNFAAPFEPTAGSADSSVSTDQDFGSSTKTTFSKSNEGKVITNNVFGTSSGVTSASKQVGFSAGTTSGQAAFQKDIQHSSSSFIGTSNTFSKASTPSAFSTFNGAQQSTNFNSFNNKGNNRPATNVNTGKYTGGFGGSPGVLGSGKLGSAVRSDGSIRPAFTQGTSITPTAPPKLPTNPNFANRVGISTSTGFAVDTGVGANKYQGTFGGPPGVLNPFDNVKPNK